ncbi:Protein N-acetyltransferase, RimJ/RimL family [Ferrimonas sediminum]|uniref:Protein N-acetyltransferase, RimJ/RimL family n=1 Tax=Ferrimonas sediminum TaxID=718193 RepID=A0A1G8NI14_9GAMM|nr:GNAT family protein [Ferrimonas sediminum]SDI79931.1 Protein N-acetyltransferase, RimJ/RimL family [Ferrimonas sediminum]
MMIQGDCVRLRSLRVEDAAEFYRWSCDPEVVQYSLSSFSLPKSQAQYAQWLAQVNDERGSISLGIECTNSGELIGYAGIVGISQLNRCGEYFILIGDKRHWGRGVGTEVTRLVTEYGFRQLGLNRIELTAFANNPGAVRAYEKAGYVHEGVLRQAGFRHGRFMDKVMMAALANDWLAT